MTAPTFAVLAGSPLAAPKLASVCSIPGHSNRRACCAPCSSLVHRRGPTPACQQTDPSNRCARTSSSPTPWSNPHSARGSADAPSHAISCPGAFRTPAASARAASRHRRRPKTCTTTDVRCSKQRPISWHSRAGGGAVHSIKSGHSINSLATGPIFSILAGNTLPIVSYSSQKKECWLTNLSEDRST
jgi:hypothetical protein